jgi:epoxyqueuosine reductase QueG
MFRLTTENRTLFSSSGAWKPRDLRDGAAEMNVTSADIKSKAQEWGADLCGIAAAGRFTTAPASYRPSDVLPGCRSVVVLARRFLTSTLTAGSTIPYTIVRNYLSAEMDRLSIQLCYYFESLGAMAVPTGAIGPTRWERKTRKSMGLISLKHAAVHAGLGTMGKNTLLINDKFGNMIWLGAVLTTYDLEPDAPVEYEGCLEKCRLCLDECPVQAMDGVSIDQRKCWEHAFGADAEGQWRIRCFKCRDVCPNKLGVKIRTRRSPRR